MPIFEFECQECRTEFERIVRRADATADIRCPVCNSSKLEEKFSAFASVSREGGGARSASCAPSGG